MPLSICTSLTLALPAYMSWKSSSLSLIETGRRTQQWHMLALATVVCFGITPFSIVNVLPINRRMKELAEKAKVKGVEGEGLCKSDEQEIRRLVEKWRKYN